MVTWCFIAEYELVATQEAGEGEKIERPADPVAPEGFVFAGWFLEDGTELFVDADGDGEIDPVVAHLDPLVPEINVIARFVEAPEEGSSTDGADAEGEAEEGTTSSDSPDGEPASLKGKSMRRPTKSPTRRPKPTQRKGRPPRRSLRRSPRRSPSRSPLHSISQRPSRA